MRHVTDGELHAFLDGAADLLPGSRGEEVRDHVAECPACRERLQDEELVRSRATEILGSPDLSEAGLPTFEELRERAEASGSGLLGSGEDVEKKPHYRGPLKGLPLAWAATIVLALGVGWMGGQLWTSVPQAGRPRSPSASLEAVGLPEASSMDFAVDSLQTAGPPSAGRDARTVMASPEQEKEASDPPPPEPAVEAARQAQRPDEVQEQDRVQARLGSEPLALEGLVVTGMTVMDEVVKPADSSGVDPGLALAAREMQEAAAGVSTVSDSLENSFAVPGLKVVSIEWEERVPGEKALLVRQLLSSGDTLELHYLGLLLGTDPETRRREVGEPFEVAPGRHVYANVLEASLPPGWTQVVMERGRGLLVARAPIEEAHLKALLKTLH